MIFADQSKSGDSVVMQSVKMENSCIYFKNKP